VLGFVKRLSESHVTVLELADFLKSAQELGNAGSVCWKSPYSGKRLRMMHYFKRLSRGNVVSLPRLRILLD
jgi:hypothetical protein